MKKLRKFRVMKKFNVKEFDFEVGQILTVDVINPESFVKSINMEGEPITLRFTWKWLKSTYLLSHCTEITYATELVGICEECGEILLSDEMSEEDNMCWECINEIRA